MDVKRKNKAVQLVVVIILMLSLMLLSVCIAMYAARDGEDSNMTLMSEIQQAEDD